MQGGKSKHYDATRLVLYEDGEAWREYGAGQPLLPVAAVRGLGVTVLSEPPIRLGVACGSRRSLLEHRLPKHRFVVPANPSACWAKERTMTASARTSERGRRPRRPNSTHRVVVFGGLCLAALAAGVIVSSAVSGPRVIGPPPLAKLQKMRAHALRAARQANEDRPSGGLVVGTTRTLINEANGGSLVNTDQDVYVVQLRGNFVDYAVQHPANPGVPHRGTYMSIVYDAETLEVTDYMLGVRLIDLSALGQPEPLSLVDEPVRDPT